MALLCFTKASWPLANEHVDYVWEGHFDLLPFFPGVGQDGIGAKSASRYGRRTLEYFELERKNRIAPRLYKPYSLVRTSKRLEA